MDGTRREALRLGGAAIAAALASPAFAQSHGGESPESCGFRDSMRASPSFRGPIRFLAAERPTRRGSYRLEGVQEGEQFVVHNYGHGGGGITMSWGSALQARRIYLAYEARSRFEEIAVLGAGVMGLTTATLLADMKLGLRIKIYADRFPPHTTSDVAGGQWSPAGVAHEGRSDYEQILRDSYRMHKARGMPFGVSERPNYVLAARTGFERLPPDIIGPGQCLERLPFSRLDPPGRVFTTLLVEPPILLRRLVRDLRAQPLVRFVSRAFSSRDDVAALPEKVVFNCTGLGAKRLWGDAAMVPVRGQLVLLPPQRNLNYLFSGHSCDSGDPNREWLQYLFPRQDGIVIGGTYERGHSGPPEPAVCRELLLRMRRLFAGDQSSCVVAPFPV